MSTWSLTIQNQCGVTTYFTLWNRKIHSNTCAVCLHTISLTNSSLFTFNTWAKCVHSTNDTASLGVCHICNFKDRSDYNKAVLLTLPVQREAEVVACFLPMFIISIMISYMLDGANYIAPPHMFTPLPQMRRLLKKKPFKNFSSDNSYEMTRGLEDMVQDVACLPIEDYELKTEQKSHMLNMYAACSVAIIQVWVKVSLFSVMFDLQVFNSTYSPCSINILSNKHEQQVTLLVLWLPITTTTK